MACYEPAEIEHHQIKSHQHRRDCPCFGNACRRWILHLLKLFRIENHRNSSNPTSNDKSDTRQSGALRKWHRDLNTVGRIELWLQHQRPGQRDRRQSWRSGAGRSASVPEIPASRPSQTRTDCPIENDMRTFDEISDANSVAFMVRLPSDDLSPHSTHASSAPNCEAVCHTSMIPTHRPHLDY